jgi:hypothetical protein
VLQRVIPYIEPIVPGVLSWLLAGPGGRFSAPGFAYNLLSTIADCGMHLLARTELAFNSPLRCLLADQTESSCRIGLPFTSLAGQFHLKVLNGLRLEMEFLRVLIRRCLRLLIRSLSNLRLEVAGQKNLECHLVRG